MNSGVYKITNIINDKFYYGSTKNFNKRWQKHRNDLNKKNHSCHHLQNAWNIHGASAFIFEIIEICEPIKEELLKREQVYLDNYWDNNNNCYNLKRTASSNLGYKASAETKRKMSDKMKQVKKPNFIEKICACGCCEKITVSTGRKDTKKYINSTHFHNATKGIATHNKGKKKHKQKNIMCQNCCNPFLSKYGTNKQYTKFCSLKCVYENKKWSEKEIEMARADICPPNRTLSAFRVFKAKLKKQDIGAGNE